MPSFTYRRPAGHVLHCGHPLRVAYRYTNGVTLLQCDTCDIASHVAAADHPQLHPLEAAAWARVPATATED